MRKFDAHLISIFGYKIEEIGMNFASKLNSVSAREIETWMKAAASANAEYPLAEHSTSAYIIERIFGKDWVNEFIFGKAGDGYIRREFVDQNVPPEYFFKLINLADLLFNLRKTDGIDNCLRQIYSGQIESAIAELEAAKLFFTYRVRFSFNSPIGHRGDDFDFNVVFNGGDIGCADAKCRLASDQFDEKVLLKRLKKYREQLRSYWPGALLVKTPQSWLQDGAFDAELTLVSRQFFKSTERVVCLLFWSVPIERFNGAVRDGMRIRQFTNENNKFQKKLGHRVDWRLLPLGPVLPSLPSDWLDLWNIVRPSRKRVVREATAHWRN